MPDVSDKVSAAKAEAAADELPYLSKSRVMQWIKNPEHFRLKYIEELRAKETDPMVRGTRIHETFERFYEMEWAFGERVFDDPATFLPSDRQLWADFTVPYIANFIQWERERYRYAEERDAPWEPLDIEDEHWRDALLDIDEEPKWMGLADVILPAASVPEIETDEGAVIVDFKTGSVPDEKYRDKGIYTELEYYTMLFDDKYDIAGALAYYPRAHEAIVQPDDQSHRDNIVEAIVEILDYVGSGRDHYPLNPGPLCGWGEEAGCRSEYYGLCTKCNWNVPVDNKDRFIKLKERGLGDKQIAHKMGTTDDAVRYWTYKLDEL